MKKLQFAFFVIAFFALISSAFAEDFPIFEIDGGYLFDASKVPGKVRDEIKIINMTPIDNLHFDVYFYDPKQETWIMYGRGYVKEYFDSDTVASPYEDFVGQFKYYAIVSGDGLLYRYEVQKKHHDLYIYVHPLEDFTLTESEKNNSATVFAPTLPGAKSFKKIKFVNSTADSFISFWVYAFNNEGEELTRVGVALLKKPGIKSTLATPLEKAVGNYSNFLIANREGHQYQYTCERKKDALIITVR